MIDKPICSESYFNFYEAIIFYYFDFFPFVIFEWKYRPDCFLMLFDAYIFMLDFV